jgi:hypothetical protein
MTGFMDNYVDVATRLKMAFAKYPDLRIQETGREVIEMPDKSCFIRCVVTIWRDANDPIPAIASACELYPGRTTFQKYSESEVGYTSAVGRCLAYMGFSGNKSLASIDEINSAKGRQQTTHLAPVVPLHEVEVPFPDAPVQEYATPKQLGMMRALANGQGLKGDDLKTFISATLNREVQTTGELTKRDMSKVIDALKASEPKN